MTRSTKGDLLELLRAGKFSREQLAEKLGVHTSTIGNWIGALKQEGYRITKDLTDSHKVNFGYDPSLSEIVERQSMKLPINSFSNPEVIPIRDGDDYAIGFANTVFAGGKTNKGLFQNFLRYAETTSVDAIVLTGNVIYMDLTRYSKFKPDRAANSEVNLDHRLIDYPATVVKSGREPKRLLEGNKPVYVTFKERLDMVIQNSLPQMFTDESNQPLYKGPIYITLGDMEEELARQHTNELVRIERVKEAEYVNSQIRELKDKAKGLTKLIAQSQKKMNKVQEKIPSLASASEDSRDDEIDENDMVSELDQEIEDLAEQRKDLTSKIDDWEQYKSRVIMTNTDEDYIKIGSSQMRGYIIKRIEKAIPNSKVISTGEAYIQLNDLVGKIIPCANKLSGSPSDTLMARLKRRTASDLHQGGEEVDFVIGGGLSPEYSREYLTTNGIHGTKTITVTQLPTCIDSKACESKSAGKVRTGGDDLAKLAQHPDFKSGAIVHRYINRIGTVQNLREEFLTNKEMFKDNSSIMSYTLAHMAIFGDQHWGSKYMSLIETDTDILPTYTVAQQMLREIGAPILAIASLGDETQERNYDTSAEGHPDLLRPSQVRMKLERIIQIENVAKRENEMRKLAMLQTLRSGQIMPQDQLHEYLNALDYGLIGETIKRADEVGLYGPSYLIINGNHCAHTTFGMYTTAQLIAREVKLKLGIKDDDMVMEEHLLQRVMAPMFGSEGLYAELWGVAPGVEHGDILDSKGSREKALTQNEHYLYALYARHKQASTKTGDNMKGSRDAFNNRGQAFRFTDGRDYIVLSGHDHMAGETSSKRGEHHRSACFMERNGYGEKLDYGAPTIGFHVKGLPVGGYKAGPVVTIDFPLEYIQRWASEKPAINMEKLFHNSVYLAKKK